MVTTTVKAVKKLVFVHDGKRYDVTLSEEVVGETKEHLVLQTDTKWVKSDKKPVFNIFEEHKQFYEETK